MTILGFTVGMPVFWLIAAVIFAVIEGLTLGLTTIWFTGGALVALVVSFLGADLGVQIVVFLIVSAVLLVFTRKLFVKKLRTGTEKTNVEALIGKEAMVISAIKPFVPGVIKLAGQDWSAVCTDEEETVTEGCLVKVVRIEGVKAVVRPLKK